VSAIASVLVCAVKFVNESAPVLHRADINIDSNILSPLFLFQFRPKCNRVIGSWYWLPPVSFIEIRAVFLRSKRNQFGTGRKTGKKPDRRGKNIMPPL